jgi:hypothetical protein
MGIVEDDAKKYLLPLDVTAMEDVPKKSNLSGQTKSPNERHPGWIPLLGSLCPSHHLPTTQ